MLSRSALLCLALLGATLGLSSSAAAQAAPSAAIKADPYAKEAVVIEHLDTVYRYNPDGTGTKQITTAIRIQSDAAARQFGVITLSYASANEHIEFDYVRVRRADGTVLETPPTDAQEMPSAVTRTAPLYSDLKEKQLPVRSLRVGDTLEYRAREVRTKAEAPGELWGSDTLITNLVVLDESLELHMPLAKDVTVWSPKSKPAITEDKSAGERVYRWTGSHLEPTVGPAADAKKEKDKTRVLTPAESADLQYGEYPLVAWTTFKSWDAVGAWYRNLETGRTVPDADIKSKVAELIAGKSTDEDKVRAIYSYVATNIRYIGVDLGVGRYQPHLASEVLLNQYGDCKDKHTLLAAMLLQAGFQPSAVLIGVNVRFNPDVPSPQNFNHVITQLPVAGQTVWLDSTEEVAPYRAMFQVLRDKDALVVPPTGPSNIQKTPANLPFSSFEHFETTGTLSADGISEAHFVITARGDDELIFRSVLHQFSPGQYDDFIQRFSQTLGFGGTTSHAEISRPESTEEPIRIAYDYKREKPGDWDNFRITPNIPFVNMTAPDEKDPPKIPIQLGSPRTEFASSSLKLPDGWGATFPDSIHVKTAFANFDKTYRVEKGTLFCDRKLEILKPEIPAADWKTFKKFTDDISLTSEPWIQLTSTNKRTSAAAPPAPSANNDEAARLVFKAQNEIQARKFDDATADLDQARKLNEKQAYLWSNYAYLSYSQGNLTDSIVAYKKELALHPDELDMYSLIARSQLGLGNHKDVEATLRSRLNDAGPDEQTTLQLASFLTLDEDYTAAYTVLKTANAALPNNPKIQLALAKAAAKAGKIPEATEILKAIIQGADGKEPDAFYLNDAAYTLADAGIALDLAERTIRKALDQLVVESATITPDSDIKVVYPRTALAIAAWDSLGWTLFREHKLAEAEPYLHAAWLQAQHPEVGLHFGQVQQAKGDLDGALTTYTFASNLLSHQRDFNGAPLPSSPTSRDLTARIAALKAKGARTSAQLDDPGYSSTISSFTTVNKNGKPEKSPLTTTIHRSPLEDLRVVPLGDANGADGVREFTIILTASGIETGKGGEDKPALKDDETIIHRFSTKSWWPANSPVKLYRKGALSCHEGKCEFLFYPM